MPSNMQTLVGPCMLIPAPIMIIWVLHECALIGFIVYVNCYSFTKLKGQLPDYTVPVVLANGKNTVEDFCSIYVRNIHKASLKNSSSE